MRAPDFSLVLLPTLKCDADCDYCFETKTGGLLSPDALSVVVSRVLDHLEENRMETLAVYWQGGEVMTLSPRWFADAYESTGKAADAKNKRIVHYIQSNLLAYDKKWNTVLSEMFGNSLGSSLDFPNLHRKIKGGTAEDYDRIWKRKYIEAKDAGIQVGVITLPNARSLEIGAERFYSFFIDELGIEELQVNTPFPGGRFRETKTGFPLESGAFARFLAGLANVWMERGYGKGVKIEPFHSLLEYFLQGSATLPCIWQDNCANGFVCVDPEGNVAQCDCWASSHPEYRFGNILENESLSRLLRQSKARKDFMSRPGELIRKEGCIDCNWLVLCHGGCPVRTYSFYGDIFRKDPYCELYRSLFGHMEETAARLAREKAESFIRAGKESAKIGAM